MLRMNRWPPGHLPRKPAGRLSPPLAAFCTSAAYTASFSSFSQMRLGIFAPQAIIRADSQARPGSRPEPLELCFI
jgi:hypothetical protein